MRLVSLLATYLGTVLLINFAYSKLGSSAKGILVPEFDAYLLVFEVCDGTSIIKCPFLYASY